nr:response regulator [Bacillus sp. USDA818B3_A]
MKYSIQKKNFTEKTNKPDTEQINILMVDDLKENLIALDAVLSSPNYRLVKARSGEEALKYILKQDFAVILLDVQMPGLNGFETAKLIKARKKSKNIPIIFITAISQDMEHVLRGYSVGAIDYIFKPFNPETLKRKVEQFVKIYQSHSENLKQVRVKNSMEFLKNQQFDFLKEVVEERTLDLLSTNEKLREEIKERKKVADDLYVSHERFKKIFKASPSLMAIRSIHNGRFIDVNQAWLYFTGYQYEDVKNQVFDWALFTCIDGHKVDLTDSEWNERLSNLKVTYQSKNGERRYGLLSTEIIDIQDESCVLILVNDITDRERLEKEMLRFDRLNLIGEMAAGIAHEIRNPMTTVHGFLQMWKTNKQPLSPEFIDVMLDELDRANSIIKEFLTLAKNKASNKTKQSLNQVIEPILPLINAEAILAGKRIQPHLAPCPELLLDEKEIRQLFLNLVLNGLEAMDAGGALTVRTCYEEDMVVLEVKDSGNGISPDILDKIGTPFFTTKEQGTGMGLAVCYSIAERHHAKIKVQTGQEGTCFSVCFHRSNQKQSLSGEKP